MFVRSLMMARSFVVALGAAADERAEVETRPQAIKRLHLPGALKLGAGPM